MKKTLMTVTLLSFLFGLVLLTAACGSSASQGLVYISNGDGTCYVDNVGSCTDKKVIIPETSPDGDTVIAIGQDAFYECYYLTDVVIPDTVAVIDAYAFYSCLNLSHVTVPEKVISIENGAFGNCYKLIEVFNKSRLTVTAGDTENNGGIAAYAKNVYTPTSGESHILKKNNYVFYRDGEEACLMSYLGDKEKLKTPASVKGDPYAIHGYAFYNLLDVTEVRLSDGVCGIGEHAFAYCQNLVSVEIGKNAAHISGTAFNSCYSLVSLTVNEENPVYRSATNCIIESSTKTLISGCGGSVIPTDGSVTSIGDLAFYAAKNLSQITIPDSVTSIGYAAFANCTDLTAVIIPDSVTSIGPHLFNSCEDLKEVTVSKNVEKIGEYTFTKCYFLTKIHFTGTTYEWMKLKKEDRWNYSTTDYTVYCTDGNLTNS